jgi:predicted permease
MRALQIVIARLRALWRRDAIAEEISEELQFHLEMRIQALIDQGVPADQARRQATRRFGNVAVLHDRGYDVRGGGWLETVIKDARFAVHLLQRRRIYSAAAILTLALGIGLTTSLISIVDAAWLRPLPFPSPDRLVDVQLITDAPGPAPDINSPSLDDVRLLRAGSTVLDAAGQWHPFEDRAVLDDGQPERVSVLTMSEGYADVYGVPPVLGRTFTEADNREGAAPVTVLGHAFWQRRFAADPGVIGRSLMVGSTAMTVVGVLPPVLHRTAHIWVPDTRDELRPRRNTGADTYARLRAGVPLAEAEAALTAQARTWPVAPGMPRVTGVTLHPLYDQALASTRDVMTMIVVSVLVLVILVCVNVAGLILADGTNRQREFAVRASLGAGRGRLIRQLLTEATVLGVIAGIVGMGLAWMSLDALARVLPIEWPAHASPAMNVRVLALSVATACGTVLLVTLWPAWKITRASLSEIISGAAQQRRATWPRSWGRGLIAIEVALAIVLLTGGGLLMRSLDRLLSVDLGFEPDAFLTMEVSPLDSSPVVWQQYFPALLDAIRTIPGVAAVGAVDGMPLAERMMVFAASPEGGQLDDVTLAGASPGYLEALGVQVRAGRTFTSQDRGLNVIVIDDTLARRLFPGGNAVGQTIALDGPMTVIGVVSTVRPSPRTGGTTIYSWLTPHSFMPPTVVIRPQPGVSLSRDTLRQVALSIGPRVLVERIRPGTDLLDENVARPRNRAVLLTLLGGLGLLLTLIGTAGVTAYSVARRTQEVGVRMAFGATPTDVVRGLTFETLRPIGVGVVLGLGVTYFATGVLTTFLFQTPQHDPVTLVSVVVALTIAAAFAAWLPARRAAHVDPVQALRAD